MTNEEIWALPIPFVGIGCIVVRDGRWLLVRGRNGMWSTPGGHLDFGESPETCAARETLEETGVRVTNLEFVAVTNDVRADPAKHYLTIWLRGETDDSAASAADPEEIAEVGWYAPEEFPRPLAYFFENLLAGRSLPPAPANLPPVPEL